MINTTFQEHLNKVHLVFTRLHKMGMKVNLLKTEFLGLKWNIMAPYALCMEQNYCQRKWKYLPLFYPQEQKPVKALPTHD